MKKIVEKRKTRESEVVAEIDFGKRRQFCINSGLNFLNHAIETIAWRSCVNIDLEFKTQGYKLNHVVAEDSGIVLGKAFLKAIEERIAKGIECCGFSYAALDDASALAIVSVEGRANAFIERNAPGAKLENVEDMLSADLIAFLNGFAQGLKGTVRINIETGNDPHEAWETAFRALGEALRKCFQENEWRKGTIAAVKGTLL